MNRVRPRRASVDESGEVHSLERLFSKVILAFADDDADFGDRGVACQPRHGVSQDRPAGEGSILLGKTAAQPLPAATMIALMVTRNPFA